MKEEDPFRMPYEGPLALLFYAKDDKIPSLLVITQLLLLTSSFCFLVILELSVWRGTKTVPATRSFNIFVVLY